MAILPIDLQVQFSQLGNLGKVLTQGKNIAANQAMVAAEHATEISDTVDQTVTKNEELAKSRKTSDGESGSMYGGFGNKNKDNNQEDNEKDTEQENLNPFKGNIIDIRE